MLNLRANLVFVCTACFPLLCYSLPRGANVEDSYIKSETQGSFKAVNRSNVNAGVTAKRASIDNSVITNKSTGTVNAYNRSNVNIGVNANDASVRNSSLSARSNARVNANRSNVSTGIDVSGARNSSISTNVNAGINAKNSNVNVGSVRGAVRNKSISTNVSANVNARNKNVNVGSVIVQGGRASRLDKYGSAANPKSSSSIGSVVVNSDRVKEINTNVGGSGSISNKIKTRHKAKFYSDTGGVDPSGEKHVYLTKRQRKAAERSTGSAGNTYIGRGSRIKKVNTYVE